MIKNYLAAMFICLCTTAGLAQTDTTYWRKSLSAGANINQSSFSSNWKAGGVSSIALALFLNTKANYLKDKISWDNGSELQYGLIKNAKQDMRKSLDRIFLDSKVGHKIGGQWNAFFSGNFITQFAPGYIYDTDATGSRDSLISDFMAPAFLTFALGFEYKPEPWFSLRLSPFAPRFTFLTNDAVAVNQRYGVPEGKTIRTEWLAAMVQADLEKDIADNLNLKVNYQAYANYQTLAFNTIDHRLSTTITAKVNRFISVNLIGILLYDRDQDQDVQLSQTLGLGILYNVQNFTDPK
jgi:hypothetical protein